jgi:ABC-type glutathione transport system ATPase component
MALLSVTELSKSYPDGAEQLRVLDHVTFTLAPGESAGLYGERRSGKTTLLRLAAGMESPDSGAITFDGRELNALSSVERAELLKGAVALLCADQWHAAAGQSVLEHVAASLQEDGLTGPEAGRRALAELEQVGLSDGSLACGCNALSSAQRARVMLALALARRPKLMLVDEPGPMPSLDERRRFCLLLRRLARERRIALLVASGDLAALGGLHTLLSISGGELCDAMPACDVLEFPGHTNFAH